MIPHKIPFHLLSFLLAILGLLAGIPAAQSQPQPASGQPQPIAGAWAGGPLLAQPQELATAGLQAGEATEWAIVILFEQRDLRFDAEHRRVFGFHRVYHVADAADLENWSRLSVEWEPWHQRRPSLGARVIGPDGREHVLDPETVVEEPVGSDDPEIQTDRRRLTAILPAMEAGVTVEEWYEIVDQEPRFAVGDVRTFGLIDWYEVLDRRIRVSAPEGLPLRWHAEGIEGLEPKTSQRRGRTVLDFRAGYSPAFEGVESHLPGDVVAWPRLHVTTARSWLALAESYGNLVDAAIGDSDLSSELKEARGQARSRERVAQQLMGWIAEEVRYNGLELSEAAIVPRSPAETLARRYGDCKDKATLLVALLRQAGFDARVALLATGWGRDTEPAAPGISHFDHAIVYVPGEPELWIDATAGHMRVGSLPFLDQDRLALVTGPRIPGLDAAVAEGVLLRTPLDRAGDNRIEEQRTIVLTPFPGKGEVAETSRAWGLEDQAFRADYRTIEAEDLKDALREQLIETMNVEAIVGLDWSDLGNYEEPFTLDMKAEGVAWVLTDLDEGFVGRNIEDLFEDLPDPLFIDMDDPDTEPRQHDLLMQPYVYQSRHLVEVPLGYELAEPTESSTVEIGPGRFIESVEQKGDRVFEWVLRFESGPARWTAEQVRSGREALAQVLQKAERYLYFTHRIETELEAGRIREALEIAREHSNREPDAAIHRARLARVLAEAGLVPRARQEARAAIASAPDQPLAHEILGNTLQMDEIGRLYSAGFDRQGAEAAYRASAKLDPSSSDSVVDLVNLLIRNADGHRYGPGTPFPKATEAAEKVVEMLPSAQNYEVLATLLWMQDRHAEILELVGGLDQELVSPHTAAVSAASRAVLEGMDAGIAELGAKTAGPEGGQTLLLLWARRHYPEAAALAEALTRHHENPARMLGMLEIFRGLKRLEEIEIEADTPEGVVHRFLLALAQNDAAALMALGSKEISQSESYDLEKLESQLLGQSSLMQKAELGFGFSTLADLTVSHLEIDVEDDGTGGGFRVTSRYDLMGNSGQWVLVMVDEGEGPKVFGLATETHRLMEKANALLAAGKPEAARAWMTWAYEIGPEPDEDDPWADDPAERWWWQGPGRSDGESGASAGSGAADDAAPSTARELGHALAVYRAQQGKSDAFAEVRAYLEKETDPEKRRLAEAALAVGLGITESRTAEQDAEYLSLTRGLAERHPDAHLPLFLHIEALDAVGRTKEALDLLRTRLEGDPDDLQLHRFLADYLADKGDLEATIAALETMIERDLATEFDLNNLAWYLLFRESRDMDRALDLARRSVEKQGFTNAVSLHTLATVLAEQDRPLEARRVVLQAIANRGSTEPERYDYFVFGRIAESLGEPELAETLYRRTEPSADTADEDTGAFSSWTLAQRRIASLEK